MQVVVPILVGSIIIRGSDTDAMGETRGSSNTHGGLQPRLGLSRPVGSHPGESDIGWILWGISETSPTSQPLSPNCVARNCCSVHVNRVRPVPTSACSDAQYMIRAVQSSFIAGNCAQAIPAPSHCIDTLTASSSGMFWYLKICVKTRHIIHIHYRKMAPHSAESTNRPPLGRFGKQSETQARPQV